MALVVRRRQIIDSNSCWNMGRQVFPLHSICPLKPAAILIIHSLKEKWAGRELPSDSLNDMMTCFDSIPLDRVSTSMTINSTASTLLSLYIVVAEKQGVSPDKLRGTTQNDILKEYISRNTYIYPPRPSLRLIGDMIEYTSKKVPQWYPISISGYHMREAGSNAIQELAFTFANAIEYIDTCRKRGLDVDSFAPRLSFFFCCTMEFFEEISKFRAARGIYSKLMKEKFGAKDPKSCHLRFHVQTSGESLTDSTSRQ